MYSKETIMMFRFFFAKNIIHDVWHLYTKMFTSNAKRLDGSSSSMDFVDGSADAATAPVIDVLSKMARCGNLAGCVRTVFCVSRVHKVKKRTGIYNFGRCELPSVPLELPVFLQEEILAHSRVILRVVGLLHDLLKCYSWAALIHRLPPRIDELYTTSHYSLS